MMDLLQDTNFWVLLSFLIFLGVFWKYGRPAAMGALDQKIDSIRTELNHAEALRVEAQELLADYQRKHKDAMKEAETIIADAKKHAEDIRNKAEDEAERTAVRREAQLKDKLERIEQNAKSDIEAYTARIAVESARRILSDKMDAKSDKDMIFNTLDNVSKTLN